MIASKSGALYIDGELVTDTRDRPAVDTLDGVEAMLREVRGWDATRQRLAVQWMERDAYLSTSLSAKNRAAFERWRLSWCEREGE